MCVFTEEEACNCILIPGEKGGALLTQALKSPNFELLRLLFFLLTHLMIPIWNPRQSDTLPNRTLDTIDMAPFPKQKWNLQHQPFPQYHTLSVVPITVTVSCSCGCTSYTNGPLAVCIHG